MFNIKTLNKISPLGLNVLEGYAIDAGGEPDGILVRSADMLNEQFPPELKAIARAGAGTNNIPCDRCAQEGIVVFNTPGANANAVKEMVLCALLLASRDVVGGIGWVNGLEGKDTVAAAVEKGKSAFAGPELKGKTLGVIGLGAIGAIVAEAALNLGMTVYGYDPFLSVRTAWGLNPAIRLAEDVGAIYAKSDYITIHVPQTGDTKGMINAAAFEAMKPGVRLVNIARGGLVNNKDLFDAIESGKVARYVTDFPDGDLVGRKGVVCIPHLGASTPESEENCAVMAAQEIKDFLENGNVRCSVNMPAVSMERCGEHRAAYIYNDDGAFAGSVAAVIGPALKGFKSGSRNGFGYAIYDYDGDIELPMPEGTIRTRKVF